MKWQQTHAVVTGGTRGIGLARVDLLVEKGAVVTATGRISPALAEASMIDR